MGRMTTEEAKLVLSVYRPGDDSPATREALARAKFDKELAAWLIEQQTFDRTMRDAVGGQVVPGGLKALILQDARPVRMRSKRRLAAGLSLAAAVLVLGSILTLVHQRAARTVDDFRLAMVEEMHQDLGEHVTFASSDIHEVRQLLKSVGAGDDLPLPAAVKARVSVDFTISLKE